MTPVSFHQQHGVMLLKYAGISFISGAVNHGFFTGARSLWTAAIGIVLFVTGAWMEHRSNHAPSKQDLFQSLWLGTLLSIGLGFFTGGLQHFPDSPARSAWVVPLGFFISVVALVATLQIRWLRAVTGYTLTVGLLVSALSWGAYQGFEHNPQWAAGDHSHDSQATSGSSDNHAQVAPSSDMVVSRSIEVSMNDQMRFTPERISVQQGETIRFVLTNAGSLVHEMVLGSPQDIQAHAKEMQEMAQSSKGNNASHAHGNHTAAKALSVPAGETREWVIRFDDVIELEMACLVPGHLEAGMRGALSVKAAASMDHSQHKH